MKLHVNQPKAHEYLTRYWKIWAGVALAGFVAGNAAFGWVSPDVCMSVVGLAGGLGIAMHHRGEPLPPLPNDLIEEEVGK